MHLNCFAGMTKRSHEFMIKEKIKFVNISKVREQGPLFSSNFAHGQRHTRKKKLIFIHMREGLQELQDGPPSPSTPSIMLSMGEDFMDKEERSHGVR